MQFSALNACVCNLNSHQLRYEIQVVALNITFIQHCYENKHVLKGFHPLRSVISKYFYKHLAVI